MLQNIGVVELSIIALILLVLFGAKRIPTLLASFGQGIRELKRSFGDEQIGTEDQPSDRERSANAEGGNRR